jgi:N-acetylated-alpha-linked acidic dipeptidase
MASDHPAPRRIVSPLVLAALTVSFAIVCLSAQDGAPRVPARIRGFTTAASATEAALEQAFKASLSAKDAEADFDLLTAEPHHVGSPYDITLADEVAARFASFGMEVSRYEYSVLVPWPTDRHVDIVLPDSVRLEVDEEKLPGDVWAAKPGILPAYNAYSPSGDVTGDIVYVNYGGPADYDTLQQLGIDVAGKIVLARYGSGWRGIKAKVAAEHGAVACLIYSDPRDDGYFQGPAYPDGPYRGLGMIQRGSVMDMPRRPGDPSTPDRPSKPGVERLRFDQIDTLAKIPVQPMAGREALELLKRLGGPVAPEAWRGALPTTYRIGAGPVRVHVRLQMDYGQRRLINVVGRIPGAEFPDQWVILGSHRDAWVYGAADPESGQTAVINVARALGGLLKRGWRPERSVLVASWDGEEPGLLGSTEWVEDLAGELSAKAVAYINLDPGAAGPYFSTSAVHSLGPFLREVAASVDSDLPGKTLYDRWLNRPRDQVLAQAGAPPAVGALGSGSDYTPFLDHLGIAAIDLGLNGPGDNGTYHSLYDHPGWFKRYIDPDFHINVRASQVTGVALLRFANAELLPFDYAVYGQQILAYVNEVERSATSAWANGARGLDFQNLRRATQTMIKAGADLTAEGDALLARPRDSAALGRINRRQILAERALLAPAGLPDRPWFRHVIYAPGLYTGYDVKTIPGVREAVEGKNFSRAVEQAQVLIRALDRAAAALSGK